MYKKVIGFIKQILFNISPSYRLLSKTLNSIRDIKYELLGLRNKIDQAQIFPNNFFKEIQKIKEDTEYLKNVLVYSTDVKKIPKSKGLVSYAQNVNYKTFLFFDRIATKYKIEYWLDFGTLLGAFRQGDFIPWDDDFDISMMRSDYEKLEEIFDKELKNTKYHYVKGEITRLFYDDLPIQLDIMPWDFYHKKLNDKGKDELCDKITKINSKILCDLRLLKQFKRTIINFSHAEILKFKDELMEGHSVNTHIKPTIFRGIECPLSSTLNRPELIDYDIIFPIKKINFRNKSFPCPNKAEERLFLIYKNPMFWPNYFRQHEYIFDKFTNEKTLTKIKRYIDR